LNEFVLFKHHTNRHISSDQTNLNTLHIRLLNKHWKFLQ